MENNTYQELWDEISRHNNITICSHINPDGDTIAVALALKELILLNLDNKEVKISGDKYPRFLSFLPKNDDVSDEFFNDSLKIVVDTSTKSRIFDKRVVTEEAIKIDHHHHEGKWLLKVGGDHWPAAGEVIYEMIKNLNLKINEEIQEYLFISIWTDTEGMKQRNISEQTHEAMASFNIDKDKILKQMELTDEENKILETTNIEVSGIVTKSIVDIEVPNDIYRQYVNNIYDKTETEVLLVGVVMDGKYRFGLRSKGNKDISKFAARMGGGGHFASSGFVIDNKEDVNEKITKLIREINE